MSPRPLTMLRPEILPLSDRNLSTCSSGIDPNQHKKRVAKSVCFVSTVDIYPVLHRRDMTIEEVQKTWFHRLERWQSRTAVENTIFLMRTGIEAQLTEDDHFCSRGLEHLSHEMALEYDRHVKKSQKIALDVQRILRKRDRRSPKMIARVYQIFTIGSRRFAFQKAEIDRAYIVENVS